MARINPVQREFASENAAAILDNVQAKMGMVPNLISTMANSPAVANAYLAFSDAMGGGVLPARLREQIALAVGESNQCEYCVSAHSMLGKGAGLSLQEVDDARRGQAADPKENAGLEFAVEIVNQRGQVSNQSIDQLRNAGFDEEEIAEVIGNVALNLFTNYFNHVAETEIDFPIAKALV